MRGCFTDTPDLTPYTAAKNRVPLDEMNKPVAELRDRHPGRRLGHVFLDEMNKPVAELRGWARDFALKSLDLDFDAEDRADEDTLNRILWFAVRGDQRYPGDPGYR